MEEKEHPRKNGKPKEDSPVCFALPNKFLCKKF